MNSFYCYHHGLIYVNIYYYFEEMKYWATTTQ